MHNEIDTNAWCPVPGGTATLGSLLTDAQALPSELPPHSVAVASFYLARCPVTNTDYRGFVEAGGYADERWWTPAGWLWRQGRLPDSVPVEEILELHHYFLAHPGELERRVALGRMLPETAAAWQAPQPGRWSYNRVL